MDCHGLSWNIMDRLGLSLIIMDYHGLSMTWIIVDYHGLSCIIVESCGLSWIVMVAEYHGIAQAPRFGLIGVWLVCRFRLVIKDSHGLPWNSMDYR